MTDADGHEGGAVARSREFMEIAKENLLTDKVVASVAFLFRQGEEPVPVLAGYRDDAQKRHFFDEALPSLVREERVDGVLVVAEAWVNGQDAIVVCAEERDGRAATWVTPYTKKFPRRFILDATEGGPDEGEGSMFAAVREVWANG